MFRQTNPIPPVDATDYAAWSIRKILIQGVRKALGGAIWVYKILVPISLFTMLLQYSHLLDHLDRWLGPLMGLIQLPAKAAMPLIAGLLTGIYGGVAAMAVMDLSPRESALIAIFLLISHNIIQESAVQGKAGIHPLKATAFRLAASITVVCVLGHLWRGETVPTEAVRTASVQTLSLLAEFKLWAWQMVNLCVKVLVILLAIMTAITWMKAKNATAHIVRYLTPVLKTLGLGSREGLLWLTAVLFGVTYGAAVIIEEVRQGNLTREELERLHLSIGINHAMIEDPSLFLPLGIHPFWLWVPRLVTAFLAVHLLHVFRWAAAKQVWKKPALWGAKKS